MLPAVRGVVADAATSGQAQGVPNGLVYELADQRDLPMPARGEEPRLAWWMRRGIGHMSRSEGSAVLKTERC